jgi:hypothetical protein
MENETIYFEIILPRSSYLNYRLAKTAIIRPGETDIEAWDRVCIEAEKWHKLKHPELYQFNETPLTVEETELVQAIQNCDNINKLAIYKKDLTKNTQKYYVEKLKTLTDNYSTK